MAFLGAQLCSYIDYRVKIASYVARIESLEKSDAKHVIDIQAHHDYITEQKAIARQRERGRMGE